MSKHLRAAAAALVGLATSIVIASGCNGQLRSTPSEITATTSQALSGDAGDVGSVASNNIPGTIVSAPLQLQVLTNSCGSNQAQQFFEVTNNGSAPINLSDISIQFWVYDTSGQAVIPHVWTGGCVTGVGGNPSCVHQVSGVTAAAIQFSPQCGPSATQQANWEITLADTDGGQLLPGATWSNIQSALNLANYSNFSPGTADWFSSCLTSSTYGPSGQFAVYYQGNLVLSPAGLYPGLTAPDCRLPSHAPFPAPTPTPQPQPPLSTAADVPVFLQWTYTSLPSQVDGGRAAILAVQGNEAIAQAIVNVLNNDPDLGHNLVAISVLGELRTQTGLQFFTNLLNTAPPTGTSLGSGFGTMPSAAVSLSMLQARAVDGLALMTSSAADALILNVIQTSTFSQVVARAVHDYLWVHGADGRTKLAALLDSQHQILLDRIDVYASGSTYNQRLAAFFAKHPDMNPPSPPIQ
jgi:hypothetical protein